jgi:hypothetical protein
MICPPPDRLPPHSQEAERGALACILQAKNPHEMIAQLSGNYFYDLRNKNLFAEIRRLDSAGKKPDVVTVFQTLKDLEKFESIGGQDYLIQLPDAAPGPSFFTSYFPILKEKSKRRELLRLAGQTQAIAFDETIDPGAMAVEFAALVESVAARSSALPEIVDAAGFIAAPIDPPDELVSGILHTGSKLTLGGSSKSFKTWALLDMALSVAHGVPWLGRQTKKGRVLFVNFEIQPYALQRRISAVAQAKGVQVQPGAIHFWNLRGHAADFRLLIPKIVERTRAENFALIILDPIYKIYGGADENSAGDVAQLLNGLESLATETGAAIAFGAHFAKGNSSSKAAIDRISGSGVFARDPDSLLFFTKHETDEAFTVEPILRNFAPVQPFVVRWNYPLFEPATELDPSRLKQAAGRKPSNVPGDLLNLLPAAGLTNADFLAAASQVGIKERSFYRLKSELESTGKIMFSKATDKWMPVSPKNKL